MTEPMACVEFVELVTAYLDDVLDAETRARFDDHLAECDGCTAYLQQFSVTVATIGRGGTAALSSEFRDRLLAAFRTWK